MTRYLLPPVALAALSLACAKPTPSPGAAESRPAAGAEPTFTRAEVASIIADARKIDTSKGIDELRQIEIGGIKQWISVRGRDRRNPILLYVHGGPASTTMPNAWFFQTPWEEYFTVVQWDQRGAGKTAAANDPAVVNPTISVDRMTQDGEEVIRWLLTTYRKQKLFLMGHSWGTFIGVNIAQRHPEWLHAYIGMGQAVYGIDNEKLGWQFALDQAKAHGNTTAVAELEKLQPYPDADGTVPIDKILVQRKWVIYYGGLTWGRSTFDYEQNVSKLSPDYGPADFAAMAATDLTSLKQLLGPPNVLDYRTTLDFRCPVFLFQGRYDYETVSEVAHAWYQKIRAPKKGFVWFENSAHMMTFEEPGKLFLHLVQDVRPIAEAAGDVAPAGQ